MCVKWRKAQPEEERKQGPGSWSTTDSRVDPRSLGGYSCHGVPLEAHFQALGFRERYDDPSMMAPTPLGHPLTLLLSPRVRGEHRGRQEPGIPGERTEAHPGLAENF